MWDKESMEEFRHHLARGEFTACIEMLGHVDPAPAQAQWLLDKAIHCKAILPKRGALMAHHETNEVITKLRSICEPRRSLPGKVKKKSKKEILAEQADLAAKEVAQKEGRKKGRGTVAKGWMQKPGDV